MTVAVETSRAMGERHRRLEFAAFAVLAYVPFLLSSPGRVSADTKQYLYLDPGRLLARAPYLWDEHIGFGTVSHQIIGYLFPMGPFYWVAQHLAVPDWVAQRFWLGTISLAAALGARWLFRTLGTGRAGAIGGALVYMLTPYQLAFTARISVLLLAWAGLPWLVALAMRSVRRGGWRDAAWFALVVLTIGSVNASSLLFVGIGPALWLVMEACRGRAELVAVVRATARMGVLTLGVCFWWIVGLRLQGQYGLPVLQLTESVRTVAADSNPIDILRGIGNWYFYGRDRLGFAIDQASSYRDDRVVIAASYAIPVIAFAAAAITRWKHRAYFVLLVVIGTVVSVGAWPDDDPSAYGRLFKDFAGTSAGLALRNTPRAVPLLVLGLAGLVAAGIPVAARWFGPRWPTVVVGVLACAALIPVGAHGFLSRHLDRAEDVPDYWKQAIAAMAREGDTTRVLEIPGSDFAAYRWGDTIEPITPGLMDRPYVARETLPSGTAASVNVLAALDRRIQEGTLEPAALAAFARLTGIGTIALRSDLEYERFDTPRPRVLWDLLTDPLPPGIRAPQRFGSPTRNQPPANFPADDPRDLGIPLDASDPPPVALFDVEDAVPIVHSAPTRRPVLLDGDGDGIVDAAAAGLLDGKSLVLEAAALTPSQLRAQGQAGADLVLTDSNRRRNQQFFAGVRDNYGYTERAGVNSSADEFRLDPFPGSTDADRSVVVQRGGTVDATGYTIASNRPAKAVDGDPTTSWLVADPAVGQRLTVRADSPQTIDHVTLAQPQQNPLDQIIASVTVSFDDGPPATVVLDPTSTSPAGQTISFPSRTTSHVTIAIDALNQPSERRNPVGFTEVGFGDVRVHEAVRLPVDLARALGTRANGHRLDVMLSRARNDRAQRDDEETTLNRIFVLPDARSYGLTGTARVDPDAPDTTIDAALGTTAEGVHYTASSHLSGDADARASRAFDHDHSTAWTPSVENASGPFLEVALPSARTLDRMRLTFVDDSKHFAPRQVTLVADGQPARTLTIPPESGSADGSLRTVDLHFDPVTGTDFRVNFDTSGPSNRRIQPVALPISIAEVGLDVPVPATPALIDIGCRDDLLRIDGAAVAVRIRGAAADARRGLDVTGCAPRVSLDAGSHTVDGVAPTSGFDLDRVVLSSNRAGEAVAPSPAGAPISSSGSDVRVVSSSADSYHLRVNTDGRPFWLVLGQSHNAGWEATVDGTTLGSSTLVNGFANGWVVQPSRAGTLDVVLRWTPQRQVWIGIAVSVVAIVLCLVLVVRRRRRGSFADARLDDARLADAPGYAFPLRRRPGSVGFRVAVAGAVTAALATGFVSRWWIGGLVGLVTLAATLVAGARRVAAVGAVVALVLGALFGIDSLGWVAVALLFGDLVVGWCWGRSARWASPTTRSER